MSGETKSRVGAIAAIIGAVAALITALVGAMALISGNDSIDAAQPSTPVTSPPGTTTVSSPITATTTKGGTNTIGRTHPVTTTTVPFEFKVTQVQLSVNPTGGQVACGSREAVDFTFNGAIVANGSGEVRYRWHRSDGAIGPNDSGTLHFDAAGTKQLPPVVWRFGVPAAQHVADGGYTLEVDAPNSIKKTTTARVACS
jgi:hypothetical protein